MYEDYIKNVKEKMQSNKEALQDRLRKIRTGQADPSLIDQVKVSYYGHMTPLSQVANISKPEPRSLIVVPFEAQLLKDVEQALIKANLGVTPQNDGKLIRLVMPELTEERRRQLVKEAKKEVEKCRVDLRMSRRLINDQIKQAVKDKQMDEDMQKRLNNDIQKITDTFNEEIDKLFQSKEKDILGT